MKARVRVDDARSRVTITGGHDVPTARLVEAMVGAIRDLPARVDHDFIIDIRETYGDGTHDHVQDAAEAFQALGAGEHPAHTCFITYDAGFVHWARAMDFSFRNRTHLCFASLEAAEQFLDHRGARAATRSAA